MEISDWDDIPLPEIFEEERNLIVCLTRGLNVVLFMVGLQILLILIQAILITAIMISLD